MAPEATSLSIWPIGSLERKPPSILAMPIVRKTQATYKRTSNQNGAAWREVKGQRRRASARPRTVGAVAEPSAVVVWRGVVITGVSPCSEAQCVSYLTRAITPHWRHCNKDVSVHLLGHP